MDYEMLTNDMIRKHFTLNFITLNNLFTFITFNNYLSYLIIKNISHKNFIK